MYVSIVKSEQGKVLKCQDHETLEDAQEHIESVKHDYPDAFFVERPDGNPNEWVVDAQAKSVVYDASIFTREEAEEKEFKLGVRSSISNPELRACVLVLLDLVNEEREARGASPVSIESLRVSLRSKLETPVPPGLTPPAPPRRLP